MRLINIFSLLFIFVIVNKGYSQTTSIKILQEGNKVSIRGLSVVNDKIIWASGNNGMVARSTNGGNYFEWIKVTGYEKRDFRDIEAFDKNTALIMGVDAPAIILKTIDGGKTWNKVMEDSTKGMFLDAMNFTNDTHGMVVGDPIDDKVYLSETTDQGSTWKRFETPYIPNMYLTKKGEAFFASSGTNLKLDGNDLILVTGGLSSRLHFLKEWHELPLIHGKESTGANSIAVSHKNAVVVGGDFSKDTFSTGNCVLINLNRNMTITMPKTAPHGYRSCVIYLHRNVLLACGTSGVDISKDAGNNWELISIEGFHVVQKAKKGNAVFLAGSNGKIAQLIF